jgi:5'-3' exonuclease
MKLWVDAPSIARKFTQRDEYDAVAGFLGHMGKIIRRLQPSALAFFWDEKRSARRMSLWPRYKAARSEQREKTPEEMARIFSHLDFLRERVLPALGTPQIRLPGMEADDLLYAGVQAFPAGRTIILTTDKDFIQLVDSRVSILLDRPGQSCMVTERTLRDYFQANSAGQYLLLRLLSGDRSDGIPGIGGLGPVKAQRVIEKCLGLEDLMARKEELSQDPDFAHIFTPEGIANLDRNWELMDLSRGEGSDPTTIDLVRRALLGGIHQSSTEEIARRLADKPLIASEVCFALLDFEAVVTQMSAAVERLRKP